MGLTIQIRDVPDEVHLSEDRAADAAFVALSETLDVPLVTCDRRLAAAPGHRARGRAVRRRMRIGAAMSSGRRRLRRRQ
jgi:hypothetical protein